MVVLMIGGPSALMNGLIDKFNKNGHQVYLLTGQREEKGSYHKVFEKYDLPYESKAVQKILARLRPDATIFMGAYDSNFDWTLGDDEMVLYTAALKDMLSAFDMVDHKGRFYYFSSEEVFGESRSENVTEEIAVLPVGLKAKAIAAGEEMCQNYRRVQGLQTFILRFDCLYWIPAKGEPQNNPVYRMLLEAVRTGEILADSRKSFSPTFLNDAVEAAYLLICADTPRHALYNISSGEEFNELQLAREIRRTLGDAYSIADKPGGADSRLVLANDRFRREFGAGKPVSMQSGVQKVAAHVSRHRRDFLDKDSRAGGGTGFRPRPEGTVRGVLPFIANLACFFLFWWLAATAAAQGGYLQRLDFYLLYVLLFAAAYGQHQAIFSGVLSVLGFCLTAMQTRTPLEVLTDPGMYVWIGQLFLVGLVVGYLRDRSRTLQSRSADEAGHSANAGARSMAGGVQAGQIDEAAVVDHKDSLGKIYEITTTLEQCEPSEVLFYAALAVSRLMDCSDVSIYAVANHDFARLFSATSEDARQMGASINYAAMHNMFRQLKKRRVYINRDMTPGMPSMAAPVYSEGRLELIVMLWNMPPARMTLGEANRLAMAGAMIQHAMVRANRYMESMRTQRCIPGTRVLEPEAFAELLRAFSGGRARGLTDYTLLEIAADGQDLKESSEALAGAIRETDYLGAGRDGGLYVLLINTSAAGADTVIDRFRKAGYDSRIEEKGIIAA